MYDAVVIGAGVIGLASARALAERGLRVLVLEQEARPGLHQSTRNSGVLHAGLYYAPGSLKAKLCMRGRRLLKEFSQSCGVPVSWPGKLVVAQDDQQAEKLLGYARNAEENGVPYELMSRSEAQSLEPNVRCTAALWSPGTGVIDASAYLTALEKVLDDFGVDRAMQAPVVGVDAAGDGLKVTIGDAALSSVVAPVVVNAAGLGAADIARLAGSREASVPSAWMAKGNWFRCTAPVPFKSMIYPVPGPVGLGVHLTFGIDGASRFGPDVEDCQTITYGMDPARAEQFYDAIRVYWPGIPDNSLVPDYSGIRTKTVPPGGVQDFQISTEEVHGVAGLINLIGIESPGLTSSLGIAEHVALLVQERMLAGSKGRRAVDVSS